MESDSWQFLAAPDDPESDPEDTNCIRQWSLDSGREVSVIKPPVYNTGFLSASYCDQGRQILAVGRDSCGSLWQSDSAERVTADEPASFTTIAIASDGRLSAVGASDGRIHLFDVISRKPLRVLSAHESFVYDVAFSPDAKSLVSSSTDGTVRMWNVETSASEWTTRHWCASVRWLDQTNSVFAGGRWYGHAPRLFSAETGRVANLPTGLYSMLATCIATRAGEVVAAGGAADPVRLWHLPTQQPLGTCSAEPAADYLGANVLEFSPDGRTLAVAYDPQSGRPGRLTLWDVDSQRLTASQSVDTGRVMAIAYHPEGQIVATGSWNDAMVRIWDASTLKPLVSRPVGPIGAGVLKLVFLTRGVNWQFWQVMVECIRSSSKRACVFDRLEAPVLRVTGWKLSYRLIISRHTSCGKIQASLA